ncbi:MAG: hypothetical protein HZA08_07385 [Nitrospirae bacterium]|nr:hypothetical protein [Nitrospirota bacterium]
MIKGKLVKFQPLKTGGVSIMIDSAKEYLHEMVDLQDAEVIIMPMQKDLEPDKAAVFADIRNSLEVIMKRLEGL